MKYQNITIKYTIMGTIFGLLFPLFSTLFESYIQFTQLSLKYLLLVQVNTSLLWVIDTAPLFLGFFAFQAGKRQQSINDSYQKLHKINQRLHEEIEKRKLVEKSIKEKNTMMRNDLLSAQLIQQSYLPEIPDYLLADISYDYIPMEDIGGDYLHIVKLREGGLGLFIADVSGHGVSAALITSLVKITSDNTCRSSGLYPEKFMGNFNKDLYNVLPNDILITCLYGLLHEKDKKILFTFSRAAHPHPIIYRSQTHTTELQLSDGIPIGFVEDYVFEEVTIELNPGDQVYLQTDGILELKNNQGIFLEFEGFMKMIEAANISPLPHSERFELIMNQIHTFAEDSSPKDDIALIALTIK